MDFLVHPEGNSLQSQMARIPNVVFALSLLEICVPLRYLRLNLFSSLFHPPDLELAARQISDPSHKNENAESLCDSPRFSTW